MKIRFKTRVYIDNTEQPDCLWVDKGDGSTPLVVDLYTPHLITDSTYSAEELARASKTPVRGLVELKPSQEV